MPISNIHDAKTNLSKLIEAALRGEEVVIAKAGKPVVRIVAIAEEPAEKPLTPGEKFKHGVELLQAKYANVPPITWEQWVESDRYVLQFFEDSLNQDEPDP
jgi:prevent-host-death family protein